MLPGIANTACGRTVLLLLSLMMLCMSACTAPSAVPVAGQVPSETLRVVTFVDAVVYSGATHYYFVDRHGVEFRLVESNDAGEARISNSELLLESDPIEGPPGPNEELIGQSVTLQYDTGGRVIGVQR